MAARLTVNRADALSQTSSRKEQLTEDGELVEQVIKSRKTSFPILDRIALNEAIVKLAPGYRAIFVLHDVEGLQHLEIANLLGCSVGTSKSQLHKARMKMRRFVPADRDNVYQSKTEFRRLISRTTNTSSNPGR